MSGTPGTPSTKALDTKAPEANPRRGFLSVAAAGLGGVFIAPGIQLMTVAHAATPTNALSAGANPQVRWGMLIDAGKCVEGCSDCVSACNTENGLNPTVSPTSAQWIRKIEIKQISTGRTASAPVMCQHCAEPPCVDVCPTGAS